MTFKTVALSLLAVSASALPALAMDKSTTAAYEAVLERGLKPGPDGITLFDYAAAKSNGDHAVIEAYINEQVARKPSTMSEPEALAYWANLYNAVTLDVVLDAYPIKSIRQFGAFNTGPWDRDVVTVEGRVMSLNDIEHGTMRKQYPTPYIHYMVNCASIGCPNLRTELWDAATLDADKKEAASDYINSNRGLELKGNTISISKIYKWYDEDFGTDEQFREHLKTYARGERLAALNAGARLKGSHYDWDLNETK